MNTARDQLFTCAGLTEHEHSGTGFGHLSDLTSQLLHRCRAADQDIGKNFARHL